MTYKSNEKSFFEEILEKPVAETKEGFDELEKKGKKKFLKLYDFGASKLRDEIKRKPGQYFFLFLTSFLGSVLTTTAGLIMFSGNLVAQFAPKQEQRVQGAQTQEVKKVVKVDEYDPLLLASKLRKGEVDFEIVDIRPMSEYLAGHIKGAINIPVYGSEIVNKDGDIDQDALKLAFKQYLLTDKLMIVYAQNSYSTIPGEIASLFSSPAKRVKALAVGWEEWSHLNSKR